MNLNSKIYKENLRIDEDIKISLILKSFCPKFSLRTLLEFGYAVDSLISHKITRFHHDIDIALVIPMYEEENEVLEKILTYLNAQTSFSWYSLPTSPHWFWLRANDPDFPDLPRQLNIHVYRSPNPQRYKNKVELIGKNGKVFTMEITQGYIHNANGEKITLEVPIPEEIAAAKIRLVPTYRKKGETIRTHDISDISRLIETPFFNKGRCLTILTEYFTSTSLSDPKEARKLAEEEFAQYEGLSL